VRQWLALAAFLAASLGLVAEDKWIYVRSGPFEVWTNGPEKQAKLRLLEAEQFRHALTGILGKQELKSIWPIRILAVKDKRLQGKPLAMVRDGYLAVIPNEQPLGPDFRRAAARLFLDANTKRYPEQVDKGLEEVLSALEVNGTRIALGAPPPDRRTAAWARIHLMVTNDAFSGRMRVYLSNLEQGSDEGVACRNSYEKSLDEVNRMVQAHATLGNHELKSLSGRPINIERDYYAKSLTSEQARIAEVDAGMSKAMSLADLQTPEAFEAQEQYAKAVEAGSKSASAWLNHALAVAAKDKDLARAALKKAAELNPQWGAPHAETAKLETIPGRAMIAWRQAANLEVRNAAYWQAYAIAATQANQFPEAAKGWAGAERAAATEAERAKLVQARRDLESQRAEFADSERRKAAEEREREIARLKAEALGEIRKAEMKANERLGPGPAVPVDKNAPKGERIRGQVTVYECLPRGLAKITLVAATGGKTLYLLIREPNKIVITNMGSNNDALLTCGTQKMPASVEIEFQPNIDSKYGTSGDILRLEFR
jgi:hypothetical protein